MNKLIYSILVSILLGSISLSASAGMSLSDGEARRIIQEAMGTEFMTLVTGTVKLKDGLNPDQRADPKRGLYPAQFIETLDAWSKVGLVNYREQQSQSRGFQVGMRGYVVAPTDKLRRLTEKTDSEGRPMIKMSEVKITRIVKNTEWHNKRRNDSEEYRLVLGLYEVTLTAFGKEWIRVVRGLPDLKGLKFRVLLKADPFKDRYTFETMDWGYVDKDGWETHNID